MKSFLVILSALACAIAAEQVKIAGGPLPKVEHNFVHKVQIAELKDLKIAEVSAPVAVPAPKENVVSKVQIAGAEAPVPETQEEFVTKSVVGDVVAAVIERISQQIRDEGYDPFVRSDFADRFALPVENLFNLEGEFDEIFVAGVSNIVINNMNFGLLTNRLRFDVSLPEITLNVKNSALGVTLFSQKYDAGFDGQISIKDVGVSGEARISIGIVSGFSIRSLEINFYLGGLQAAINNISLFGVNYAAQFNSFINNNVFNAISSHAGDIGDLIEHYAWEILN